LSAALFVGICADRGTLTGARDGNESLDMTFGRLIVIHLLVRGMERSTMNLILTKQTLIPPCDFLDLDLWEDDMID
jgi:hypothetical protein